MIRAPHRIRSFGQDEGGLALVEFALVLPVLLLLYLGGYQLCDAISCNRKVTITARAVADLTSQNAAVTTSLVTSILNASTQIMAPYSAANAFVRVTELQTDASGKTTVAWSQDNQGGGLAPNTPFTLPANIKVNSSCIILGEVNYSYTMSIDPQILGPVTLSDSIYMNPRVSPSVDLNGVSNTICHL